MRTNMGRLQYCSCDELYLKAITFRKKDSEKYVTEYYCRTCTLPVPKKRIRGKIEKNITIQIDLNAILDKLHIPDSPMK